MLAASKAHSLRTSFFLSRVLLLLPILACHSSDRALTFSSTDKSTSTMAYLDVAMGGLIAASTPIGTLPGSAGVSHDGAATYSVPIEVPKGRAGMEPTLSVNYSSNGGAGPMGIGVTLGGISAIVRCPLDTVHPDALHPKAVDLCFGGRLLLAEGVHDEPGAVYRVHGNAGLRITKAGDPGDGNEDGSEPPVDSGYVVSYPNGKTGLFGSSADSIATADKAGGGSRTVAWYLKWLDDNFGNRMRYDYLEADTGTVRLPSEIRYAYSYVASEDYPDLDYGSRVIKFHYQEREPEDVYTAFRGMAMGLVEMDRLLISVETFVDDDLVFDYRFSYKNWTQSRRSVLNAMDQCDADGVCLPYTKFEWELGEDGYEIVGLPPAAANTAPNFKDIAASVTLDVDHDGKMELLFAYDSANDDGSARWNMWDPETGIDPTPVPARFVEGNAGLAPSVADINGDGVADLITPHCDAANCVDAEALAPMRYPFANKIRVILGDKGDADGIAVWGFPDLFETNDKIFMAHVAEIDGDGYPDMFACVAGSAIGGRWHLMLNRSVDNNGVGREFVNHRTSRPCFASDLYQVMDADGDGRDELWVAGISVVNFNQGADAVVNGSELQPGDDGLLRYVGLELPREAADGSTLSIEAAVALTGNGPAPVGWPESGVVSHDLGLDFSQRILQGCWRPDSEETLPAALHAQIVEAAGQEIADKITGLYHHPGNPKDIDGTIPQWLINEKTNQFSTPPIGTRIPANIPFVSAGSSPDRQVDLNGDGLPDIARLARIGVDGESKELYQQANASSPPSCRADEYFDFGFEFFINTGISFEPAGTLKLLEGVQPWQAAQFLSRVTPIDYNSDGRTDWLSPDFGKYFGDDGELAPEEGTPPSGGVIDKWEILVTQPMIGHEGPIEVIELDLDLTQLWYDASHEWSEMLEHHVAALFEETGETFVVDSDINEFPDIVARAVTAIHLSDRHLQDIIFFPGTDSDQGLLAGAKAGDRPDYLRRVTDGLGKITEWDYRPGHDSSVYGMEVGTEFAAPFTPSMLVSAHRTDSGLGADSWMHRTYKYIGAYADRRGLGGLGVRQRTVATRADDEETPPSFSRTERGHLTSYDASHRAYPRAGLSTRSVTDTAYESGGARRRVVENLTTWESVDAPHSNYAAGARQARSRTFDLHDGIHQCVGAPCSESALEDETPLTATQTDVEDFNEFGLALDWTVNHGGGVTTQTILEVDNHADNDDKPYAVGLERRRTVISSTANGSATRVVSADYDPATLALSLEVREPEDTSGLFLRETSYGRDVRGNIDEIVVTAAGESRLSTIAYDPGGTFAIARTNAAGHTSFSHRHPTLGVAVRSIDPNGVVEETCVDGFGRPTCARTRNALLGSTTGEELTFELEAVPGNFVGEAAFRLSTYRNGLAQLRVDSDRLGREKRRIYRVFNGDDELGDEYEVLTTYDPRFQLETVSNPISTAFPPAEPPLTSYTYDRLGRKTQMLRPDGSTAKRFYQGLLTVHTDASGDETKLDRDVLGRLAKRTTGALTLCFDYGAFGSVVGAIRNCNEADGQPRRTTVQAFDKWNRRELLQDPELGIRFETWDGFDQLDRLIDGNNDTTSYVYDSVGRLTSRTSVDGTASWTFDTQINGIGKPATSSSEDGTVTRELHYDDFGRPSQSVTEVGDDSFVMENEYLQNRLHKVHYPVIPFVGGGLPYRVRYQHDDYGHVTHVYDDVSGDALWELQGMDGFGHLTQERAVKNDFITQRFYDELTGRQSQDYVANDQGDAVVQRTYSWSGDGNLDFISDLVTGETQSYGYDALDQLRTTFNGQTETASVKYDIYGNIEDKSEVGTYKYSETSGRLSSAGDATFHYDSNGSVLERADKEGISRFEWTAIGKLRKAETASGAASFDYDASGVEVRKTVLGGAATIATTTVGPLFQFRKKGVGSEYRYTIMAGGKAVAQLTRAISPGYSETLRYLHRDYRGSTIATSEVGGDVTVSEFDAWGQKLSGLPGPFSEEHVTTGFTGHDAETVDGLIDMRARYYDPRLGRFMSADTIVPNPANGLDWNRYAYVRNNPLKYIDPSGHGPTGPSEEPPDDDGPDDSVGDSPEGEGADPGGDTCTVSGDPGMCEDYVYPFPNLPSEGVTGSDGTADDPRSGATDQGSTSDPYRCSLSDAACNDARNASIDYLVAAVSAACKADQFSCSEQDTKIVRILNRKYKYRDLKAGWDLDGNGTRKDEAAEAIGVVLGGATGGAVGWKVGSASGWVGGPWGAAFLGAIGAGAGYLIGKYVEVKADSVVERRINVQEGLYSAEESADDYEPPVYGPDAHGP